MYNTPQKIMKNDQNMNVFINKLKKHRNKVL